MVDKDSELFKVDVDNYKGPLDVLLDLAKAQNKLDKYEELVSQLTITAPKAGMIIYAKEWNGRKRVVGSTVNVWDPEVANVPDLREMEVISYVNEVDIQKVKAGQKVDIGLEYEGPGDDE